MKTGKHDQYTYRVTWAEEDGEHVGLCAEFPSLNRLVSARLAYPHAPASRKPREKAALA